MGSDEMGQFWVKGECSIGNLHGVLENQRVLDYQVLGRNLSMHSYSVGIDINQRQ